jgi:HK97 family phage major capsid protein
VNQDLKVAREKAAELITKAHGFAQQMHEDPAHAKEHEAAFDKVFAEFANAKKDLQKLEAIQSVQEEYERIYKPAAREQLKRLGIKDAGTEGFNKMHSEAFSAFLRGGETAASAVLQKHNAPAETYALIGTVDDLGGFLVPEDFRTEIMRDLPGYTVVRQAGARVVPTSRDQLVFPAIKRNSGSAPNPNMYTSNYAGAWRQQGAIGTTGDAPPTQNQPTFGQERIPVHIWQPDAVVLTQEFLSDAVVPVDSIVAELIAETRGLDEDWAFLNGDGVDRPQGLLSAGLTAVNTGSATDVTYAGLIDLYVGLPAQYRGGAGFIMSSATYGNCLKLNTGTGGWYIFPPNTLPGTMFTKPVYFSEFMPAIGSGNKPIIFGNFRHYVIAERMDLRIQRLVERFAPNVGLLPTARVGGQVVRTNAFRVANCA